MARTAVSISPCPVRTMIGGTNPMALSLACTSSPLMPGILTSRRTQPPERCGAASRKAPGVVYETVANPIDPRSRSSERWTATSSSTTWIVRSAGIEIPLRQHRRESEAKEGSAFGVRFELEAAAVRLDNRAADRQAHAHTTALGGYEWLKNVVSNIGVDAGSAVGDGEFDQVGTSKRGRQVKLTAVRPDHGIQRIAHEVDQDLLNVNSIAHNMRRFGIKSHARRHARSARTDQCECARLVDHRRDIFDARFGFPADQKVAQPAYDLRGAQGLLHGFIHSLLCRIVADERSALKQALCGAHGIHDRRQRLVELMCKSCSHLPRGAKSRRMDEFEVRHTES